MGVLNYSQCKLGDNKRVFMILRKYYKRLISIAIVAFVTIAILMYTYSNKNDTNKEAVYGSSHAQRIIANNDDTDEASTNLSKSVKGEDESEHNTIKYIVDIVSIDNNIAYGDTATLNGISGRIMIDLSEVNNQISVNNTYVITVKSLIKISNIPIVTAVKIDEASEEQVNELDNYRKNISNYNECLLKYNNMDIDSIVDDANRQYVYWTQNERKAFLKYIKSLGYNASTDRIIKIIVYNNIESISKDIIVE